MAASCTAALLLGCATPPPADDGLKFVAAGRLSVRVDATPERPAQSLTAAFEWRGDGVRGELKLLSPLGTQLARAHWSPGDARLETAEGETRFATLDDLAERALGERVPLAAWPDWLAGRPWPGAAASVQPAEPAPMSPASHAATGSSFSGFQQLGWSVDLSRRADGRIEARRSQPPVVTVRIVLDGDADIRGARP